MTRYSDKVKHKKNHSLPSLDLKSRVLEATDADEQAHNLKGWHQQYNQISNGSFYGRINEVSSTIFHVFREYTNQAIHQQCNISPDSIWLGFTANNKNCRISGHDIDHHTAMVRSGNTEFELITPEKFDIYGLVLNQNALLDVAQKQGIPFDLSLLKGYPN